MNVHELQPRWPALKPQAQARWKKLTDEDLEEIGGNPEQLVRRLQERYGYPRSLVLAEIGHFLQERREH
ncbi:MAG: hypothetical protein R2752_18690 [Vicinamibacterales bacterium]